ncbi:MAG: hypothetical protein Q7S27_06005 [Nanoarchaeota archaeon]|nr:hypothetical protein [Nanoarchaeota archaeon]
MAKTKSALKFTLSLVYLVAIFSVFSSAITISSVESETLTPGQTGSLNIELSNELEDDATSVSIRLDLTNLPFISIGNSEDSIDEIDEGDEEEFSFRIKAANDIAPGDYKIPYVITYTVNTTSVTRQGTIGITIRANADLSFSAETEKPVIGTQTRLTLKVVNKGFADAKFVSVTIEPQGFTLLSDKNVYIGNIDSDDFETISFDVVYRDQNSALVGQLEYRDFDNKIITKTISIPLTVYTKERALELGLIEKSNTGLYIGLIIALILIIVLYRVLRSRMRKAKRNKLQES